MDYKATKLITEYDFFYPEKLKCVDATWPSVRNKKATHLSLPKKRSLNVLAKQMMQTLPVECTQVRKCSVFSQVWKSGLLVSFRFEC